MPDDGASAGNFMQPGNPTLPNGVAEHFSQLRSLDHSQSTREIQALPRDVERDEYAKFSADASN